MDDNDSDLPGVTFWVVGSGESGSINHKFKGHVELTADIDDEDVWREVLERLNGYRVYSIDDFNTQMMKLLREENEELVRRNQQLEEKIRVTEEQAKGSTLFALSEKQRAERMLVDAEQQARIYRAKYQESQIDNAALRRFIDGLEITLK